jgi:Na+/H+ antiporter NhaD/arsenite permease-like protein
MEALIPNSEEKYPLPSILSTACYQTLLYVNIMGIYFSISNMLNLISLRIHMAWMLEYLKVMFP